MQRDVVTNDIEHLDLLLVRRGEKVSVEIPVTVVGESASGTTHSLEAHTLLVLAEATSIPEVIEVSIEGLEAGTVVRVSDLVLPKGVTTELDPETDVLNVSEVRAIEEDESEAEGAEESAADEA